MLTTLAAASCLSITALIGPVEGNRPDDQVQAPEVVAPPSLPEHLEQVNLDSGVRAGVPGGDAMQLVFSEQVGAKDAPYIRLVFGELDLPGELGTSQSAYLAITSLQDGAVQYLDAEAASQWQGKSAYFNGSTVLVELFVSPKTEPGRVSVTGVIAGEWDSGQRSICGTVDDRELSQDPRVAYVAPIGCTAWLFNDRNNCMLTAGHCGPASSQVIWFNTTLSTPQGNPVAPPPEDQYAIDPVSTQSNNGGIGNDWSTFGVFNNSNTGLTPLESQGSSFQLAESAPSVSGQSIRVTGHGVTSAPVDPTWNLAQKTHAGPYVSHSGTTIRYEADTTGGNSGGPVIDETTGMAIGIHTNAGCNSGGNQGTAIQNSFLQNAIDNPQGVCLPPSLTFDYPFGRPDVVSPDGGDTVRVVIGAEAGAGVQPDTARLHIDDGSGEQVVVMTEVEPSTYEGVFPPIGCGVAEYFITAEDTEGETYLDPPAAPEEPFTALAADAIEYAANLDFESDTGWTVQNGPGLIAGAWERGVPVPNSPAAPGSDFDLSGQCWLTGNFFADSDVDGGPTELISSIIDISTMTEPRISYARWFTRSTLDSDALIVSVSDDGGTTWEVLETIDEEIGEWLVHENPIPAGFEINDIFRIKFTINDTPNNSRLEAAIDQFQIFEAICDVSCNVADLAEPYNALDFADVIAFLVAFGAGDPAADLALPFGEFDFNDVVAFLTAFGAGCP